MLQNRPVFGLSQSAREGGLKGAMNKRRMSSRSKHGNASGELEIKRFIKGSMSTIRSLGEPLLTRGLKSVTSGIEAVQNPFYIFHNTFSLKLFFLVASKVWQPARQPHPTTFAVQQASHSNTVIHHATVHCYTTFLLYPFHDPSNTHPINARLLSRS